MSVLDYAENPSYAMVSIAVGKDNVVIFSVSPKKITAEFLETAIGVLQAQKELLEATRVFPVLIPRSYTG